ncbi:MAG: hypothetical protein M1818_003393 [Claussenomyces sp. TS43310]|nr:MAG: hypothetical protein M1818_003393 [Claussenomyces sp. TS43310]
MGNCCSRDEKEEEADQEKPKPLLPEQITPSPAGIAGATAAARKAMLTDAKEKELKEEEQDRREMKAGIQAITSGRVAMSNHFSEKEKWMRKEKERREMEAWKEARRQK